MIEHQTMHPEALLYAVCKGDKSSVRNCISNNMLPPEKDWKGGYRFLNQALAYKEYAIARMLLDKVTVVNNESERAERTPLHYAATDNKWDIINRLLEKGAEIDAIDEHDMTPLHYAVILDHQESVDILLEHGASTDEVQDLVFRFTPYQHACKSPKYQILESFLNNGSNVNEVFEYPDNLICPKKSTPLHMAITQKNLDSINLLLERHADVNHANVSWETSLHLACRENNETIVEMILSKKAVVNVKSKENITPLYIAVKNRNIEIVDLLLNSGADTEIQDNDGKNPLQVAVEERDLKIVERLLELNHVLDNENNQKAFNIALLETGIRSEIFQCFVKHGFTLSRWDIINVCFSAVKRGYFHTVETMLDYSSKSADIKSLLEAKFEGDTLLHCATKNHQHDIVRLLLKRKADLQAVNDEGNMPIIYAIENSDEQIIKTLMAESTAAKHCPLILHTIIQLKRHRSRRLLELFLQYDVDVNERDGDLEGLTALHLVCRESMACDVELADFLLRKGANVNAATSCGTTALHMAASRKGSEDLIRTLLKFEPDLDARDKCGSTPLHLAATLAASNNVRILLDAGANINIENNCKMTPMDVVFCIKDGMPQQEPGQVGQAAQEIQAYEAEVINTFEYLQQHVAKLDEAEMYLKKNLTKYLTEDHTRYQVRCGLELERIKDSSINSHVTLYDVLQRNILKIVRHTSELSAKNCLESIDFKMKYPIYGSMIDNAKKAVMREYIVNNAKEAIILLTGYGLPDSCTENIFIFLKPKDLRNLAMAMT